MRFGILISQRIKASSRGGLIENVAVIEHFTCHRPLVQVGDSTVASESGRGSSK